MGNRAVITTPNKKFGIYLHWNGGRDSVEAFLTYCKLKGYRSPDEDCYGWARMCQVIGNFFGGDTSIGFDVTNNLDCDNFDNGMYIIKDWQIIDREFQRGAEQQYYDLHEFLHSLNKAMPPLEQLDPQVIDDYCIQEKIPLNPGMKVKE